MYTCTPYMYGSGLCIYKCHLIKAVTPPKGAGFHKIGYAWTFTQTGTKSGRYLARDKTSNYKEALQAGRHAHKEKDVIHSTCVLKCLVLKRALLHSSMKTDL